MSLQKRQRDHDGVSDVGEAADRSEALDVHNTSVALDLLIQRQVGAYSGVGQRAVLVKRNPELVLSTFCFKFEPPLESDNYFE